MIEFVPADEQLKALARERYKYYRQLVAVEYGANLMSWIAKSFAQLTEELFAIYQLRTSVFVVEQQCAYQEVDHWDKVAFWQEFDGKICAYCRIIPQDDGVHIGRVLVVQHARGKGLAKALRNKH